MKKFEQIEEYHGDIRKDSERYFQSLSMGERLTMMMDFAYEYERSGLLGCANKKILEQESVFDGTDQNVG